jgi:hypothetical protein
MEEIYYYDSQTKIFNIINFQSGEEKLVMVEWAA